jgi:hypothetical protein
MERWTVRTLRAKIGGMLFERTALSRKPEELARQELIALREEDRMSPDLAFRDPYFLDFLGLADTNSNRGSEFPTFGLGLPFGEWHGQWYLLDTHPLGLGVGEAFRSGF